MNDVEFKNQLDSIRRNADLTVDYLTTARRFSAMTGSSSLPENVRLCATDGAQSNVDLARSAWTRVGASVEAVASDLKCDHVADWHAAAAETLDEGD